MTWLERVRVAVSDWLARRAGDLTESEYREEELRWKQEMHAQLAAMDAKRERRNAQARERRRRAKNEERA